jgi:hypothetical protein
MSIREKLNPLIKSCGTRTVPSTGTKSVGLAANAQVSWFLLSHLDSFIVTRKLSSTHRDLVPSRQIIVTRDFSTVYPDLQKPRHRDTDGNSPNRRAVMCKHLGKSRELPTKYHFRLRASKTNEPITWNI